MKKRLFTLLLALVAIAKTAQAQVVLDETNFPDANFRSALASKFGISEGTEITAEKIAATTLLRVSSRKIANLTGIEHFTALTELYCYRNQLTSLDVSSCTALKYLDCNGNQLTSLDVSGCTELTGLDCSDNQLTSLDVSKNTALTWLGCSNNQLTLLDVSKNTALTTLQCSSNQLTSLDVSGCTALTGLTCSDNQLTSLDVSQNTALTYLWCFSNQLTSLGVSGCTALKDLRCYNNQLTSLDVSNNTALTILICGNNQLTSLDVSGCTALTSLSCDGNQLTSLDVSKNTALTELYCFRNQIKGEAMDALVKGLPTVENGNCMVIDTKDENEGNVCTKTQVTISKRKGWKVYDYDGGGTYNQETYSYVYPEYEGSGPEVEGVPLNAENFPDANFREALAKEFGINEGDCITITEAEIASTTLLRVSSRKIADLTGIEHFTALTELYCGSNQLTSLDVSKNTALTRLDCGGNQLTSLDVSKNTELTYLQCGWNGLTSLDMSNNTILTELLCYNNQLTSLDISKNVELKYLYCSGNQLTSLEVYRNDKLKDISCYRNLLSSLDVSKNTELKTLYCNENQLTSLDVSKNTALTKLDCRSNQIKGEKMNALVASLPAVEWGEFIVINTNDENEKNVCTKSQVTVAKEKGWTVYDYSGTKYQKYEGSDELLLDEENFGDANFREALSEILNINESEEITEEIIEKTTTLDVSEKAISNLSGVEHFTVLTTLYCHINQIKSEEMAALIAALPDLNSNEAKGMMRAEETNPRAGALYALDFTDENEQNVCTVEHVAAANAKGWTVYCKTANGWQEYDGEVPTGIHSIDNGKLTIDNWYSVDGKKVSGEPKNPGLYIRNGKKVVK